MGYEMNLLKIPLDDYREHLRAQRLMPSRKILHEEMDAHFDALKKQGIDNVGTLRRLIGTEMKIKEMARKTRIPADYLNILRREIGSLVPKKIKLADFPGVDKATIEKMLEAGIRNSKDFFDKVTLESAEALGICAAEYEDIHALCDVVRISGMGAVAARIFVDAGQKTVEAIAEANAQTLWEATCAVNDEKAYYGGVLSVKDMQFCIDYASMILQLPRST